jgi:ATP-binding cassette subfamily B protein
LKTTGIGLPAQGETMKYGQTFAFVWSYWRKQPARLAVLVAGLLFTTACDVFFPVLSGRLADAVASGASGAPTGDAIHAAGLALLGLIGLELAFTAARFAIDKQWVRLETIVLPQLVVDVFHRVQRFSTDWHANSFAGATVRKITRGRGAFDVFTNTLFFGLLPAVLIVIGITLMVSWHWPLMGLFLAVVLVAYILVSYLLASKYLAPANRRFIRSDTRIGALLADSITCNAVVKAFGAEAREDRIVRDESDNWGRLARVSWGRHVNTHIAQRLMSLAMMSGMLGIGILLWTRGLATPGQITMVLTSYFVVSAYVRFLGQHLRNLQQSVNDMEDMVTFTALPMGVQDRADAAPFRPGRGAIAFCNVTFGYENQPEALYRDFCLTIPAGQKVGLVGRSGSGKSTFVKLIQRLYDVQAGALLIDGQDVAAVRQESLRARVAIVPQDPALFHRSLAENIAYARPGATMEEIVQAARKAHAHEFITRLRDGYETLVGERGVKLSGGERQRVALARAFLADAPILILDEATSSLDGHTEALIQDSIGELMKGRTTIVIAHRLSTIRGMDRILLFEDGRLVEDGPHDELMTRAGGRYQALVTLQTARDAGAANTEWEDERSAS